MLKDFLFIVVAYLIVKLGYMVLFNNFFHLVTLKGKKAHGTYLDKFSRTLGYSLIALGFFTALLTVIKRYFPDHYLYGYVTLLFIMIIFLFIKFFSYKNEEREIMK